MYNITFWILQAVASFNVNHVKASSILMPYFRARISFLLQIIHADGSNIWIY